MYLVGRADALSTTFYLLALIAYQSFAWRKRNISIGCHLLSGNYTPALFLFGLNSEYSAFQCVRTRCFF